MTISRIRLFPALGVCAVLLGFAVPAGAANDALRCSETARAYASGEISGIEGVQYLKSCVAGRIAAMKAEDAVKKARPREEVNPLTCQQDSGKFAVQPDAMTPAELAYLDACLDADLEEYNQGE